MTSGAANPAVSASMIANTRAARTAAPISAPAVSTRCASGSALSGRIMAPSTSAASPKTRLNQKMARQFHTPTSAPPTTGPSARARPDTAAQTPMARSRLRRSVYRCRSIDSVPGSLAAAPSPMTARPAISTPVRRQGAQDRPGAKDAGPGQHDDLAAQLVADHPAREHHAREGQRVGPDDPLQGGDPCVQVVCTLPSATLTTVLSRKVRNSSVHSTARASDRPP